MGRGLPSLHRSSIRWSLCIFHSGCVCTLTARSSRPVHQGTKWLHSSAMPHSGPGVSHLCTIPPLFSIRRGSSMLWSFSL